MGHSGCLIVDALVIEAAYPGTVWLVRPEREKTILALSRHNRCTFFCLLIIPRLGLDSSRCSAGTSSTASFWCLSLPRSAGGSQALQVRSHGNNLTHPRTRRHYCRHTKKLRGQKRDSVPQGREVLERLGHPWNGDLLLWYKGTPRYQVDLRG
ncbi:hypothetical protein BDW74DRAFT_155732 [Aspergillus multicolor]|uniref:uncharacterized protein n=1 Tax=Aspergillus multicolor TaxID=41759 RepID=UPI003CCE07B0